MTVNVDDFTGPDDQRLTQALAEASTRTYPAARCRRCNYPLVLCVTCGENRAPCGEAVCYDCEERIR